MYAIALIRYRRLFAEIEPTVEAHRAYLKGLQAKGLLLASGTFDPRTGGALILRLPDEGAAAALDAIRDDDPYTKASLAQYEILPWAPVLGREGIDRL